MTCDLSIIIVNWNGGQVLANCLASLPAALGQLHAEVWIVDNASHDDSLAHAARVYPQAHVIRNAANLGFAAANNQAAAHANGRYLLLLNPDTQTPPAALAHLVAYADAHPAIGALGPQLRNPDGSLQRSCWPTFPGLRMALTDALYLWKLPWLPWVRRSEYSPAQLTAPRPVAHLLGACLLIPRRAWDAIGPLDDRFFLFLEETDWCRRAGQAGWQIVYHPHIWLAHLGQHAMRQAPPNNLPHLYRSYTHFCRQQGAGRLRILALKAIFVLAIGIRLILWSLRWLHVSAAARREAPTAQRTQAQAMLTGYWRVLRLLPTL